MTVIEATRKKVVRQRENIHVREITSFEQLNELNHGDQVAIMNTCDMVIGEIMSKEKEWIIIDVVTSTVVVKPDSFKYKNFMYEVL